MENPLRGEVAEGVSFEDPEAETIGFGDVAISLL